MNKKIPFLKKTTRKIHQLWISLPYVFDNSKSYWIERYESGGNSGDGSYNELAEFKAEILNQFVERKNIKSVIEFGCGDGNQLRLCEYPSYIGFDISPDAIKRCKNIFKNDDTREFRLISSYADETAELTLSLDVIFHLVEDQVFEEYMHRLFDASEKYVIIYSSDYEDKSILNGAHVRHRKFTVWVDQNISGWKLIDHIPNRYPLKKKMANGSPSDFFIYEKQIS
jgi:SAM-dependent methyltransferase